MTRGIPVFDPQRDLKGATSETLARALLRPLGPRPAAARGVNLSLQFPFALPEGKKRNAATATFEVSTPLYRGVPGLIRKTIRYPRTVGLAKVCISSTRADAERLYEAAWRAAFRERLGAEPSIEYCESPMNVDNDTGAISTAA